MLFQAQGGLSGTDTTPHISAYSLKRARARTHTHTHTHTQGSNAVRLHVVLVVEKDVQNDLAVRKFAAGMRSALPIRPVANRLACSN